MKIQKDGQVVFEPWDRYFVKKFGVRDAADMVLDFKTVCPLPFLYDVYQLTAFLQISRKQLFDFTNHPRRFYRKKEICKKNGTPRYLYAPREELKAVQRIIYEKILSLLPISPLATAYRKGIGLYQNARPHCGKRYLLKLDIKDFFGSIRFSMVYNTIFHTGHFPKNIGTMLTSLCCRDEVLPQGAPSSPAISNIVMKHFDDVMGKWCAEKGIAYTRYCDDMTFSGDATLYGVYRKAKDFLEHMGFAVNEAKTHFISNGSRQSVTGLVVNRFPQVPSEARRQLRQELYYFYRFGAKDVILKNHLQKFMTSDGKILQKKYARYLRGKIGYILQVDPANKEFQKEYARILQILSTWDKNGPEHSLER